MSVGKARKESSSKGQSGNAAATRTKKGKFGDKTEEEVMSLLLPDRLGDNMDILFVSFCFEAFKFLIDLHLTTEYYFIKFSKVHIENIGPYSTMHNVHA